MKTIIAAMTHPLDSSAEIVLLQRGSRLVASQSESGWSREEIERAMAGAAGVSPQYRQEISIYRHMGMVEVGWCGFGGRPPYTIHSTLEDAVAAVAPVAIPCPVEIPVISVRTCWLTRSGISGRMAGAVLECEARDYLSATCHADLGWDRGHNLTPA